ncbi:MAG: DHH family phosphoesterase [Clostridia bacterium]|nr:DHH family phosphoesterase [Clostridia bacterium]
MKKLSIGKIENFIKQMISTYPITTPAIVVCVLLCLALFLYNVYFAVAGLLMTAILIIIGITVNNYKYKKLEGTVAELNKRISVDEKYGELQYFPLPVAIFDSTDTILWYNQLFSHSFLGDIELSDADIKQFTSNQGINVIREKRLIECEFNNKKYTAFPSNIEYKDEMAYVLYFIDDTELKNVKVKYEKSRPVFLIINIDSVEDAIGDLRESQQSDILGDVEQLVENWLEKYNCISRKINTNRFIVVSDSESLIRMKEDKFSILSKVRSYTYNDKVAGITLSIGVGEGETFIECEKSARKSLDMAMGRGGDQVALKTAQNDYEFFGGVAKGVEKRTKVRTRMVASAIGDSINISSNVLIMGHRNADLDALGASVGVAMICKALGKDAKIVMSSETTLAMPLAKHLIANGLDDLLVEPEDSKEYISSGTLLIVVDTHRQSFLEYPELFDMVQKVIVIDHHRKAADYISKSVIFYHEPNASSTSEMVAELIQYVPFDVNISKTCAEALMSGITLDTKNFVMKTGVRTFEAAAYLRSLGADTVTVKQLFANSMETQKAKSEIVKSASMYGEYAIGVVDFIADDVRVVAGQAADELLNIDGVSATFVLYSTGNCINISARSYGEVNVQVIMEELNGGGHQTMAAAQLPEETFENALALLKNAIDTINNKAN